MVSSMASQPEPIAMMTLLRVGSANVVEQMIMTAGQLAHLLHYLLNDFGGRVVVLVGGLTALEVDVGVLRSALLMRMLGVQARPCGSPRWPSQSTSGLISS